MKSLLSFFLVSCLAIATATKPAGDTLVLPNGHEMTPGAGGQVPFNPPDGNRSQNIYAASHFGAITSEGILIDTLAFRLDESDDPANQGSIRDVEIRMSTTPSLRPIVTLNLNDNIGSDYRTVFRGKVEYSIPQSPENVNPFSLYVRLQEPFLYDPKQGSFLVDILTYSRSTTVLLLDAGIGPVNTTLAIDGNTVEPTGNFQVPLVMQLGFVSVPEPTIYSLAILGWVCWMFARKGRK